ncbi:MULTISPECIES: hypothetical protein [Phenylobacterium]|uniref:Sporulation protein YlmC with PRC-barrel domain n=1 Tax=Phenylobacterium koreense TaxID=266125 RepID=A0ABV2EDK9_9CAUL
MKSLMIGLLAAASLAPAAVAQTGNTPLGVTREQLEDADLLDASGREIGEVENLIVGTDGMVTGVIVEIDQRDPLPDRRVQLPLAGLKAVPERGEPDDFDVQTQQTREQLLALPEAR